MARDTARSQTHRHYSSQRPLPSSKPPIVAKNGANSSSPASEHIPKWVPQGSGVPPAQYRSQARSSIHEDKYS